MRHFDEKLDETFRWKIRWRQFDDIFDETFWYHILMRHFDNTFWWHILMRHFDETFGWKVLGLHMMICINLWWYLILWWCLWDRLMTVLTVSCNAIRVVSVISWLYQLNWVFYGNTTLVSLYWSHYGSLLIPL